MSPHSLSNQNENQGFRFISKEDVAHIESANRSTFDEIGMEWHSFKIGWYNHLVAPEYVLDYNADTLAFVVISTPSMFEKAFLPFLAESIDSSTLESSNVYLDPIDKCMKQTFTILKQKFSAQTNSLVDVIHDFELYMPYRRPKILLQTAAHISGAAYYYKIQNSKQRLGVCIHPTFGGWFGIRGVFIFPQIFVENMSPKIPPNVVSKEKQMELLVLFNERWQDSTYRNIIPVQSRYSSLQIEYFSLKPKDRIEFIKSTLFPILFKYRKTSNANIGSS